MRQIFLKNQDLTRPQDHRNFPGGIELGLIFDPFRVPDVREQSFFVAAWQDPEGPVIDDRPTDGDPAGDGVIWSTVLILMHGLQIFAVQPIPRVLMPPEGILPSVRAPSGHWRFDDRLIPRQIRIVPQQLPAQIGEDGMVAESAAELAAMVERRHVRPDARPVHFERVTSLIGRGNFRIPKAGKLRPDAGECQPIENDVGNKVPVIRKLPALVSRHLNRIHYPNLLALVFCAPVFRLAKIVRADPDYHNRDAVTRNPAGGSDFMDRAEWPATRFPSGNYGQRTQWIPAPAWLPDPNGESDIPHPTDPSALLASVQN